MTRRLESWLVNQQKYIQDMDNSNRDPFQIDWEGLFQISDPDKVLNSNKDVIELVNLGKDSKPSPVGDDYG